MQVIPGLSPVGQDSGGYSWKARDVLKSCASDMGNGNYFQRRVRDKVTPDYEKAADACLAVEKMFGKAMDGMLDAETRLLESARKTSSSIRKSANEIAEGFVKMEKTANFDRLERYVALLERSAAALSTLAELEREGRLERITQAMR